MRPQDQGKSIKTRRYKKDADQVHEELQRQVAGLTRTSKLDTTVQEAESEELPGEGEFPSLLLPDIAFHADDSLL